MNGVNLQIYRAYLQISDHCRVTVRVRAGAMVRVRKMVRVRVSIRVRVGVGVADCCIQTPGKSDKMRINDVIKTDEWRSAPLHILSYPLFDCYLSLSVPAAIFFR